MDDKSISSGFTHSHRETREYNLNRRNRAKSSIPSRYSIVSLWTTCFNAGPGPASTRGKALYFRISFLYAFRPSRAFLPPLLLPFFFGAAAALATSHVPSLPPSRSRRLRCCPDGRDFARSRRHRCPLPHPTIPYVMCK